MRLHIILDKLSKEFWITDMPATPRGGDTINFSSIYHGDDKELIETFENNGFKIESVTWTKVKDGYVAMLFCDIVS